MYKIKTINSKLSRLPRVASISLACLATAGTLALVIGGGKPLNPLNSRQQQADSQASSQPTVSPPVNQAPLPAQAQIQPRVPVEITTVGFGSGNKTLMARDNIPSANDTEWKYKFINGSSNCNDGVTFNGSNSGNYTEGNNVGYNGRQGKKLCFRSRLKTDTSDVDYRASDVIDETNPTVTVSNGSVANSFKATDNESSTSWKRVLIGPGDSCNSSTSFANSDGASNYTENNNVVYTAADNSKRWCFRAKDNFENSGYRASSVINVDNTAPTVTVSRGSADGTFKAVDNDNSSTTWKYALVTGNDCDSTTNFNGSSSYTEGDDLVHDASNNGKKVCFRSTDGSNNRGYGLSATINIDLTPPVVRVLPTTHRGNPAFKGTDDDPNPTTWHYVFIAGDASCDYDAIVPEGRPTSEGIGASYAASNNGQRICFRSTDAAGNHGYGASDVINVDVTPPTVTVRLGSADDSFQANDNDSGPTTWVYVLITNTTCDSTTDFNNPTSYTEGSDVVHNASNNGKKVCFRSTDGSDNAGYGISATIHVDVTPPVVRVLPTLQSGLPAFKGVDDDSNPTEWFYVFIAGNASCDLDALVSGGIVGSAYVTFENAGIVYYASNNGQRICFRSTDAAGNHGYGASDVINVDVTPPTVTVRRGSADDSFQANDNDSGPTTWVYVLITNTTCNSTTSFSGSTSYTEGSDVVHNASNNGKKVCFRSTDGSDNAGYGISATIHVDVTPPVVRVLPTLKFGLPAFKGVDDDSNPTEWFYVFIAGNASCDLDALVSGGIVGSAYVTFENTGIPYDASHNGQRICFRSTDAAGNHGYGASDVINVDVTPPTVTVRRGSADDSFQANDNDSGPTTWVYVLIDNTTCNSTTSFSGSTSYTEGDDVVHNASNNGKKVCFRSTDGSDNAGYGISATINIDLTPPVVTVSATTRGGNPAFKGTDDDPNPTDWFYVFIAGDASCDNDAITDSNANPFQTSENIGVNYAATDNGKRICFRSTDAAGNHGYGASDVINVDVTPPTVTVRRGSADDSFQANDNDSGPTTWVYVLITNTTCDSTTDFNNPTSYTEGSDVVHNASNNGKKVCFRSTDGSDNAGYGISATIHYIDTTAPTVTVSPGSARYTFKATDDDSSPTTWKYVLVTGSSCGSANFNNGAGSSYQEGADFAQTSANNGKRVCFRSTNNSNSSGYGLSNPINLETTPPTVTIRRGSANGTFQANDNDSGPTTWAYVVVSRTLAGCNNSNTNFNNSTSYREGDDVVHDASNNGKKICFRSTDAVGNHGYGLSATAHVDNTSPTISRIRADGSSNGLKTTGDIIDILVEVNEPVDITGSPVLQLTSQAQASYHLLLADKRTIVFRYQVAAADYNSSDLNVSGLSRQGATIKDAANNNLDLSLPSSNLADNNQIIIDTLPPTISLNDLGNNQISASVSDASDQNPSLSYIVVPSGTACQAGLTFQAYSGAPISLPAGQIACFEAVDHVGITSYRSSANDVTAPVITITGPDASNQLTAVASDNLDSQVSFDHQIITATTVCNDGLTTGFSSYDGSVISLPYSYKACFRASDAANNSTYQASTAAVDPNPPVITVSGVVDNQVSATATDAETSLTSFEYQLVTADTACDDSLTTGFSSYDGSAISLAYSHKACFRATDSADNAAHQASTVAVDITPPVITVSGVIDNQVSATAADAETGIASFEHQLLSDNQNCGANLTDFNTYINGSVLSLEAEQKACFKASNGLGQISYADSSNGQDDVPPVISVGSVTSDNQVKATVKDDVDSRPSFEYKLTDGQSCDQDQTGFSSYDGRYLSLEVGRKACFKATDASGNSSYKLSGAGQPESTTVTKLPETGSSGGLASPIVYGVGSGLVVGLTVRIVRRRRL